MGMPLSFELLDSISSKRWQFASKTEKVTSLLPGRGNLANKRAKTANFSCKFDLYSYI